MTSRPPRRSGLGVRLELGIAAFIPAFTLLALRSRSSDWVWVFAGAATIGAVVLVAGALLVARGNPDPFEFDEIADLSGEILGHIGAYLLPVVIDSSDQSDQLWISAAVLALIVHIHVATGRVFVNPILYLFGYRVYQANSSGKAYYLIAHTDVSTWTSARRCVSIGASVLVERHVDRRIRDDGG